VYFFTCILGNGRRIGYRLGSYRIATAPEPNSSRLTSFKSIGFDSPANNVGPWPASYHGSSGIVLLEANCNYDPDVPQITLKKGIRSEIAGHYKWAMEA